MTDTNTPSRRSQLPFSAGSVPMETSATTDIMGSRREAGKSIFNSAKTMFTFPLFSVSDF